MPPNKILVGTDFSDSAEEAVTEGLRLAAESRARLVLAHALAPPELPIVIQGGREYYLKLLRDQLASSRACLDASAPLGPIDSSFEIVEGFAAPALSRLAAEIGADLLVVGTHGRTGFRRLLLGSVAEKIVRISQTDVLVVRPRPPPGRGYRRILVPTDFSAVSDALVELALGYVDAGGTIDVLHAWQLAEGAEVTRLEPAPDPKLQRAQLREEIGHAGEALLARHRSKRATLAFAERADAPVRAIQERLEADPYDLVVVGSHGRRGFRRFVVGSVAEATIRYSPCSVLVSRAAPEAAREEG